MGWIKKGIIYEAKGQFPWMKTHASMPIADKIHDDVFRVFFSTRNSENMASVAYVDLDINNPKKIIKISSNPILSPGKLGTFDDTGVMASSLINYQEKKYLYYIGWNQSKTVPFRWSIGLAISEDNGESFKRYSEGPIMDRNIQDPYFVTSPTVFFDEGKWKMWYVSGKFWEKWNGSLRIPYNIRYAESKDGIIWDRKGIDCLNFKNVDETRIGRASVIKEDGIYKMWYSYAGEKYRIGYAESHDGLEWERKDDKAGIDVSSDGWDSEMIEYSYVFDHKGNRYMLYNGNNYGETGFGYAILE